ncbi:MAG: hypothetical protein KKD12_06800 [Proteobacteria bacterium]|nr:hypothetical protein [Pseudomonadota bacterium]MBU4288046.1 hypothetical protein [Pseudomonadota bacterium]MCG2757700.1 hypothetical protein [Desulfobacteraceae bacterium]
MINVLTDWIDKNPSPFASLVAAVVAASVALIVFGLTHHFARKREQIQFLTGKLEELYLSLNQVAESNAQFFKLIALCLAGHQAAKQQLDETEDIELYGHRLAKRIIMLIRLYFPRLSSIHQRLFATQRHLNELIFQLHSETPPELKAVVVASGRVGHFIRLMEEEVIRNRDFLLRDCTCFKRYMKTTQAEIEAEIPPPDGPIMNLPKEINENKCRFPFA